MPCFWDSSAVIRICVPGQASSRARKLLRSQPPVVWWATVVEVRGALERLHREHAIATDTYVNSRHRLEDLLGSWREIQPVDMVRDLAGVQLERFVLCTADALQLAAALVWCKQNPRGRLFVCNDARLTVAAQRAGFDIAEA